MYTSQVLETRGFERIPPEAFSLSTPPAVNRPCLTGAAQAIPSRAAIDPEQSRRDAG